MMAYQYWSDRIMGMDIKDEFFRVEVISRTPYPQTAIWFALHQDYSEDFVYNQTPPPEDKAGTIAVRRLLEGRKGHHGPLEHPQIIFNIGYFPHSVMQQARTHRILSFDVQCLSGDTVVTFVDSRGKSTSQSKKTMAELYDIWTNGEKKIRSKVNKEGETEYYRRDMKKRIKKMKVRSLDEASNTFTYNHIEDVVFSGLNPVYKVTLANGSVLECTQNHKIYTPYGWRVLAQLSVGSQVMVNGVPLKDADKTYQNKEWLKDKFAQGLIPREVASIVGCSTEAVKRWSYKHGLTWEKRQWNKGIRYNIDITQEERERRSNHAKAINKKRLELGLIPSGADHPSWKDLPTEKRVYNWLKYARQTILKEKGGVCIECGSTEKLHCHHIKTVKEYPELAYDMDNIELLCSSCHSRHHHEGTENPLCAHPVEIVAIEYKGVEATYDLVLEDPHHNFVANGVVVHNSCRYSGERFIDVANGNRSVEEVFYLRPVGQYYDRQGNRYFYSEEERDEDKLACHVAACRYKNKIEAGHAPEHARGLIPFDFRQHFVVSMNMRSLMHFLLIRGKKDAQLEIQQLAWLMLPHFQDWAPQIYEWFMENEWLKGFLAP
jgi:thymidylate synthase (FAD)